MSENTETGTALVLTEALVPAVVFAPGGAQSLLEKLKAEVRSIKRDISTPKGRAAIKSLALKVARSKTALDAMGKDLVSEWKAKAGLVDADRRMIRDELDALKEEVLSEVTAWEESERVRIEAHEARIKEISDLAELDTDAPSADQINDRIKTLNEMASQPYAWQEFAQRGHDAFESAGLCLTTERRKAEVRDAAEAERARIAAEEEAARIAEEKRLREEHEAEIARAAAERARIETEERAAEQARIAAEAARKEQERVEREKKEAIEAAERARIETEERAAEQARIAAEAARKEQERVEREKKEAIEAAERAEAARKQAELDALARREAREREIEQERIRAAEAEEARRLAAEREAERRENEAREQERRRIVAAAEAEAEETRRREADKKHRAGVNSAAMLALQEKAGVPEELAKAIIVAIAKGQIPAVKISY